MPTLRRAGDLSLPCFNDVHHVCVLPAGNLLVVSTGLDAVMEINESGESIEGMACIRRQHMRALFAGHRLPEGANDQAACFPPELRLARRRRDLGKPLQAV